MQYTIRNVPKEVDRELRRRAKRERKSLNEVALDVLRQGAAPAAGRVPLRDFSDLIGKSHFDAGFDQAMADFDRIDPKDWE